MTITLRAQATAVRTAKTRVSGIRPAERELLERQLEAAIKTLEWLERNEHRIREALGPRSDP